jgi:hypothetical protein
MPKEIYTFNKVCRLSRDSIKKIGKGNISWHGKKKLKNFNFS